MEVEGVRCCAIALTPTETISEEGPTASTIPGNGILIRSKHFRSVCQLKTYVMRVYCILYNPVYITALFHERVYVLVEVNVNCQDRNYGEFPTLVVSNKINQTLVLYFRVYLSGFSTISLFIFLTQRFHFT